MRQPNYKLGWLIPNKVAALTHFHSDVTSEDFLGVIQTGQTLLSKVDDVFHIIIDNRVVKMPALASLDQMRQMVPYMSHPMLRWVVVVKPEALKLDTSHLPIEHEGDVQLKNVSSLSQALSYLQEKTVSIDWSLADKTFFP